MSTRQYGDQSAVSAADHPPRGIFHPLGAAFFSNATYPETLKVIDESGVSIQEFALAGARQEFQFNVTTGATEPVPNPSRTFVQLVAAEVPRYIQLWYRDFAPISTANFKVWRCARNHAATALAHRLSTYRDAVRRCCLRRRYTMRPQGLGDWSCYSYAAIPHA